MTDRGNERGRSSAEEIGFMALKGLPKGLDPIVLLPINRSKRSRMRVIIWVLLIVVLSTIGILFFSLTPKNQEKTLSIQEIITDSRNGLIVSLEIYPDGVLAEYQDGTIATVETNGLTDIVTILVNALEQEELLPNITFAQPNLLSRIWTISSPYLSIVVIALGVWFFARSIVKPNSADPLQFDYWRSQARVNPPDRPSITFADIGGIDEEKEIAIEMVRFLREPEIFVQVGARIPSGVLISGPPGCGKTLLAQAIAGESDIPFFSVSGSEFVESFAGVGASRVRDLFDQARQSSPCIVFIDHLDSIALKKNFDNSKTNSSNEGQRDNDEWFHTLNQLLNELDGFDTDTNVIFFGATERPDLLDPALLRPGRISRHIRIKLPNEKEREQIIKLHARGKPIAKEVDFSVLAQKSEGFSGAALENWMNEAAIVAARQSKRTINTENFNTALEYIVNQTT